MHSSCGSDFAISAILLIFMAGSNDACTFTNDAARVCNAYKRTGAFAEAVDGVCYVYMGDTDLVSSFNEGYSNCDTQRSSSSFGWGTWWSRWQWNAFDYGRLATFETPSQYICITEYLKQNGVKANMLLGSFTNGSSGTSLKEYQWAHGTMNDSSCYIFGGKNSLPSRDVHIASISKGSISNPAVLVTNATSPYNFLGYADKNFSLPYLCEFGCGTAPKWNSTPAWAKIATSCNMSAMTTEAPTTAATTALDTTTTKTSTTSSSTKAGSSTSTSTISTDLSSTSSSAASSVTSSPSPSSGSPSPSIAASSSTSTAATTTVSSTSSTARLTTTASPDVTASPTAGSRSTTNASTTVSDSSSVITTATESRASSSGSSSATRSTTALPFSTSRPLVMTSSASTTSSTPSTTPTSTIAIPPTSTTGAPFSTSTSGQPTTSVSSTASSTSASTRLTTPPLTSSSKADIPGSSSSSTIVSSSTSSSSTSATSSSISAPSSTTSAPTSSVASPSATSTIYSSSSISTSTIPGSTSTAGPTSTRNAQETSTGSSTAGAVPSSGTSSSSSSSSSSTTLTSMTTSSLASSPQAAASTATTSSVRPTETAPSSSSQPVLSSSGTVFTSTYDSSTGGASSTSIATATSASLSLAHSLSTSAVSTTSSSVSTSSVSSTSSSLSTAQSTSDLSSTPSTTVLTTVAKSPPVSTTAKSSSLPPLTSDSSSSAPVSSSSSSTTTVSTLPETSSSSSSAASPTETTTSLLDNMTMPLGNETDLFELIHFPISTGDTIARTATINAAIPFITASLSPEKQKQMGMQWSTTFVKCHFDESDCLLESDFRWDQTATFGSCFTFNHDSVAFRKIVRAGAQHGLSLTMFYDQGDYLCTFDSSGFKVTLQHQTESPFPEIGGFYAVAGVVTSVILRRAVTTNNGHCIDQPDQSTYYYNGSYTLEGCLRGCYQRFILEQCGCADPRYAKPKRSKYCTVEEMHCLEDLLNCGEAQRMAHEGCSCQHPCIMVEYSNMVTTSAINFQSPVWTSMCDQLVGSAWNGSCAEYLRKSVAILNIYYDRLSQVEYNEEDAYPVFIFLTDMCQSLGFYFSMCVTTVIELLFLIGKFIMVMCQAEYEHLGKRRQSRVPLFDNSVTRHE